MLAQKMPFSMEAMISSLVSGPLSRKEDADDRRNLIISFTPESAKIIEDIDERLNKYIFQFFSDCDEKELATLEEASRIVCRVLDAHDDEEI